MRTDADLGAPVRALISLLVLGVASLPNLTALFTAQFLLTRIRALLQLDRLALDLRAGVRAIRCKILLHLPHRPRSQQRLPGLLGRRAFDLVPTALRLVEVGGVEAYALQVPRLVPKQRAQQLAIFTHALVHQRLRLMLPVLGLADLLALARDIVVGQPSRIRHLLQLRHLLKRQPRWALVQHLARTDVIHLLSLDIL